MLCLDAVSSPFQHAVQESVLLQIYSIAVLFSCLFIHSSYNLPFDFRETGTIRTSPLSYHVFICFSCSHSFTHGYHNHIFFPCLHFRLTLIVSFFIIFFSDLHLTQHRLSFSSDVMCFDSSNYIGIIVFPLPKLKLAIYLPLKELDRIYIH